MLPYKLTILLHHQVNPTANRFNSGDSNNEEEDRSIRWEIFDLALLL